MSRNIDYSAKNGCEAGLVCTINVQKNIDCIENSRGCRSLQSLPLCVYLVTEYIVCLDRMAKIIHALK